MRNALSEIYNTEAGAEDFIERFSTYYKTPKLKPMQYDLLFAFMREWQKVAPSWEANDNRLVDRYVKERINALPDDFASGLEDYRKNRILGPAGLAKQDPVATEEDVNVTDPNPILI